MSAEAEGVGQGRVQFVLPCRVGDDVEITVRIGVDVIDRGGNHVVLDGQHTGHGFDAAGTTQKVAGHRFGGAHRDLQGPIPEGALDRGGFVFVVRRGARAVSVDVIHLDSEIRAHRLRPALER